MDEDHVGTLIKEMTTRAESKFTSMVCNIPAARSREVDLKKVKEGSIELEVLGGNHTRVAVQRLHQEMPDSEAFKFWPVKLYCGLSPVQSLQIGYDHNRAHLFGKAPTFQDLVCLFRGQMNQTREKMPDGTDR